MNDIFKLFKKRAQSGKSTNITDVIKDLNDSEKDEIGKFDRGNKSYLSISKSGRLKSKKNKNSRIMNEDFFDPNQNLEIGKNSSVQKVSRNEYDQHSDNVDSMGSSASSSFRSSLEEIDHNKPNQQNMKNFTITANKKLNQINYQKKF
ncbi:unnamed protein product [Brachionus calyciflorus]|uniref:Uncharacterized protein n=1 Tax=Brachionus calyciflorus TaxID=104777 RepID=A0A813MJ62_9BILA|nr:unnamed protein product [Brachionus calyciflorus]